MEKREEPSYFVGGNVNWYMENSMEVLGKLKVELEKETATHSSIIAWRVSWTEEPDLCYSPWTCQSVRQDLATK